MSYILDTPLASKKCFIDSFSCRKNNETMLSNVYYEFSDPIYSHPQFHLLLSVSQFNFTNSIYNVTIYNNSFFYNINGNEYSFSITPGFYDIETLVTTLNDNTDSFVFIYNETTMKVTITRNSPFILSNQNFNIFTLLGFNIFNDIPLTSFSSDCIINLSDPSILFISSDISVNNENKISNRVLYSTMITTQKGELQQENDNSAFRYNLSDLVFTGINFRITDRYGNLVDFNNIHWTLTLNFSFILQKETPVLKYLNSEIFDEKTFLEDKFNINNNDENKK